jgi:hypothetical protein
MVAIARKVDGLRSEPNLSDCCNAEAFHAERTSTNHKVVVHSSHGLLCGDGDDSRNKNHNTPSTDLVGNEGAVKPV